MSELIIGILKSSHPLKLKNVLIEKLLSNNVLFEKQCLDLNDFLIQLEDIWCLNDIFEFTIITNQSDFEEFNQNLKKRHEDLRENYDLVQKVLLNINNKNQSLFIFNDWVYQNHLNSLFDAVFKLELMTEDFYFILIKNSILLLITWFHLIVSSFVDNVNFVLNLVKLLNFLNSNFSNKSNKLINYYYFIQNDFKFSAEYLFLIKMFNLNDLMIKFNMNSAYNDVKCETIESAKFEIIALFLNAFCFKQNLNTQMQRELVDKFEILQPSVSSFQAILINLNEIVKLVKSFLDQSSRLFEWTLKYLIDLLSDISSSISSSQSSHQEQIILINQHILRLNMYCPEFFKCFNINLAEMSINNYFNEAKAVNTIDDISLKSLLFSLIYFLCWPFESNIDEWIRLLMTIIAVKLQKFQLLIDICKETIDFVIKCCQNRSTRSTSLNVLYFFIINYQHSPALFNKVCQKIEEILLELKSKENDQQSESQRQNDEKCYKELSLICYISINAFGGYPEIYKNIIEIIQNDVDLANLESFKNRFLIDRSNLNSTKPNIIESNKSSASIQNKEIIDDEIGDLKKFRSNVTGLINLGNTCYLNSIMQSLFACKKFVKNILELDNDHLNLEENSFLYQIQALFSIMHLTNRAAIKPNNFVNYCTPSWFKFGQQQDSSEFLTFLLDNLNEQLKNSEQILKPYTKLVQNTFGIQLTNECECAKCFTKTTRTETSLYLPLSFTNQSNLISKKSLQDLIENFFKTEKLSVETENPYSCSKCQSLQTAYKKITVKQNDDNRLPDYLILCLNRFIYKQTSEGIENIKIMDQLEYPKQISIETVVNNGKKMEKYDLASIVVHSGSSIHYGHYYSYILNSTTDNKNEWLIANDSHISHASHDNLVSNLNLFKNDTPYVLFYKRLDVENSYEINVSSKKITDTILNDNQLYIAEQKQRELKKRKISDKEGSLNGNYSNYYKDNDDDDPGPKSTNFAESQCDSVPRFLF